jgi:predicted TIM-barrel fold metal-dependent hydrolase
MVETDARERRQTARSAGIVDCDVHNELDSPRDLFPYLAEPWRRHLDAFGLGGYSGGSYPRFWDNREEARPAPGRRPGSTVASIQSGLLDRHDIAYAVLNPLTPVAKVTNLDLSAALATAVNDWQVAEWLDRDARLRASIIVPFEDPPAAVREIGRRASDRRFVQVQFSGRPHEPMGRRRYWPIYEACAALGLPVMSHAFGSGGNPITGTGWPSYYIEDHVGPPQSIQANVISMATEGVFARFPALRMVSVENGFGWLPALLWRMEAAWRVLGAELAHLDRAPADYVRDHLYLSTQPTEEPSRPVDFQRLFEHCPELADRLMFASDYPHWDGDAPDRALPSSLPEETRRRILSDNARGLYGLP